MVRKELDEIKKEEEDYEDYEDIYIEEEKDTLLRQQVYEQNQLDIICDIRIAMIKYCDKLSIPLCDYLTIDIFEKFIENLY